MTYSLEKVIDGKKVEILYRHGNTSVIGSLFISIIAVIIVYYFIWPADKPVDVLLIWLATFLLVSTMRLYGIILYKSNKVGIEQSRYWLYAFTSGAAISACLWGLLFLYLVGFIDKEYRYFILFFMVGLISAVAITYATSLLAFFISALCIIGPVIIYFILHSDPITNYTGHLLIVYLMYLLIIARQLNKTLEEFLAHEFNISRLEREKQYAAMLNRELEEEILKRINTEGKLKDEIIKAEALTDKLVTISSKDGLTGINNRRRFDEYLENEWNRSARTKTPLSLIMCDIDFYKAYNDTYGHLAGDDSLKKVANVLEHYARRAGDLAARFGGEEFVIILPDTESDKAVHIAEQIRTAVEDLHIQHSSSQISDYLTISLGVATIIPSRDQKPGTLINFADEALYQAKKTGRNKSVVYGQ